ncbi:MAG: oligoendopeptidase F [Anaerolineae bacterium]
MELKTRSEIAKQYQWDLESIFADTDAWKAAIDEALALCEEATTYQGLLGDSPGTLADFLELGERLTAVAGKVFVWGYLPSNADTTDTAALANRDRVLGVSGKLSAATAFADPEILLIPAETLQGWIEQESRLTPYAHFFDRLRQKAPYVRSAEVEQVLGTYSSVFSTMTATHGVLANADLQFNPAVGADGTEHAVAQGTIRAVLANEDREVRKSGYLNYADAHLAYKNTMANALSAGIKRNVATARIRGYESGLDMALTGSFIPHEVFHNLIDTFKANLPTWHRYWAIRRKALGLDELHEYDLKAGLSKNPPKVTYEESVQMIAEGMLPLGSEYVNTMRTGCLENRWVDVFPNQGKRMGAFSSGQKGTKPFIMMSYTEDLFGMSTLAHELGHSMHSYLTWENNEVSSYARYGMFVAETASNFNQAMVRADLLEKHDDPEFQIAIIEEAMANFHRYFFIMPTLARLELAMHERIENGQALTADVLIDLTADLYAEGYGDEVVIDRDRIGITWAQFHTHLYSRFYVYQYATGIAGAHALADRILSGTPGAADDFLNFLKAGGSVYPMEALAIAGVDMTQPEPVETAFRTLAGYVDRLEKLIEQRG